MKNMLLETEERGSFYIVAESLAKLPPAVMENL